MAFKTKAQTLTLMQAGIELNDVIESAIVNDFNPLVDNMADAITPDGVDLRGEENGQLAKLKDLRTAMATLSRAGRAVFASTFPSLGYYAGAEDPYDGNLCLAKFYDKLVEDSENVVARGLDKDTSWTAGGDNVGDGTVFVFDVDAEDFDLDISHPGDLTLKCSKDVRDGANTGNEEFTVTGSARPNYSWDEGGAGINGGGYTWKTGQGLGDFGTGQQFKKMGETIKSIGPSTQAGNLITNGDFEASWLPGATTAKIPAWTLDTNHANIDEETDDPIAGDSCPVITGQVVGYQLLTNLRGAKQIFGFQGYIETVAGGSGEILGTFTLTVKDDSTTHAQISVDLSTLTPGTPAKMAADGMAFILPANVGANLRIEFEQGAITGTGTGKAVKIDNIGLVRLAIVDGGRAVGIYSGLTDWQYQDVFTYTTSSTDEGRFQYWVNRTANRYLPSDTAAVYWTDPTYAPAIAIYRNDTLVADAGSIALGSVPTGAHAITLEVRNTGNDDLVVLVPTHGTDTNITSVGVSYTVGLIVPARTTRTFTLTVTDAGAGAFSTIVSFVNNTTGATNPYTITVSGTAT